jgi:UDP-N-acetylmuramyl tripeptide synthase
MNLLDSRRLTGPNLLLDRPGAVLSVSLSREKAEAAAAAWKEQARRILDAVGWAREEIRARVFPGGASLAITAPIDALYAATEVNELAWAAAEASFRGQIPDLTAEVERLREEIAREAQPGLLALRDAARARGVAFLWDPQQASVGLGTGSLSRPLDELPDPESIDWSAVHDVPVALVTGTNGKTTAVRLLAAMVAAAGRVPGITSTDCIEIGGEVVAEGDCSGPGGARAVLRDRRVEIAILETARGGILRRGLAVDRVDAALITNIAADHLGEFGIYDLASLTAAKLVITRAVRPEGRIVLNADDPQLTSAAPRGGAPVVWFSLGGAARHNVANALAALGLATVLELPAAAMAAGLRRLGNTPEDNPGRANLFGRNGYRILVDDAHNPHGLLALLDLVRSLPAKQRLLVIGQAGDRDDEAIRALARAAWELRPDRVIVKELPEMLRGRRPGEVPAILTEEFLRLGAPPESVTRASSELRAVHEALAWARPGDLLVLLVHTQRQAVLEVLR